MFPFYPDGDEGVTWTPSSGSQNFAMVDEEVPDGDSSYVETESVGNIDQYGFQNAPSNLTNINAVNANKSNIDAVAGNATNINAVAGNATNINAVNANKTNIDAVAGNATNINAVNANKTNIDTCATNIAAIIDAPDSVW